MIDLHHGDCLEVMRGMPDSSVDAVVTDPPYGIRFMGKTWDGKDIEQRTAERRNWQSHDGKTSPLGGHNSIAAEAGKYDLSPPGMLAFQAFSEEWAREAFRVLKPGGYLLTFASTRTYHRMTCGVESVGFEIRDQIGWAFGSGFPKSHNGPWGGTALKPAWEPICVARKPLIGTVEQNWKDHGTGALNIDGCRVETSEDRATITGRGGIPARHNEHESRGAGVVAQPHSLGRWPANLIHDGSAEVVAQFPAQAGAAAPVTVRNGDKFRGTFGAFKGNIDEAGSTFHADTGSAARFFYCAKATKEDRNDGCQEIKAKQYSHDGRETPIENAYQRNSSNSHPTVKPTDLMRYLCRLVTPANGVVLDPFMGSGSTGRGAVLEGFRFIGIEREAEYIEIARARIDSARRQGHQPSLDLEAA